jgi:hypothetical protein
MGRTCNSDGEKRNEYRILVAKPEGRRRRVGNIKIVIIIIIMIIIEL